MLSLSQDVDRAVENLRIFLHPLLTSFEVVSTVELIGRRMACQKSLQGVVKIPYNITTRPRTATATKPRGRKRAELSEDVVTAVQYAVDHRDEETVIGPFADEAEAKKLWGSVKARLRDDSFGPQLSARGGVAASTDGTKWAVIFSVTNRRAKTVKKDAPADGETAAPEAAAPASELETATA